MGSHIQLRRWNVRWTCAKLALLVATWPLVWQVGCARLRLPSIDPTGNRIFLPGNSTSLLSPRTNGRGCLGLNPLRSQSDANVGGVFQPAPFSTAPLPAGPTPVVQNPVPPSYPIQPAFQHAPDPPPCNQPAVGKHQQVKHVIPKIDGKKTPGQNGQIIMTPSRIVAPVNSEVVVLAGICGGNGFFVKNQPLEWMLSNNSVGQIIEVGGMNHAAFNKLVPPTSRKHDGQYASGRTGLKNILLTRGTPTPVDDIELVEGQTYISVASASPGTSYITGFAPNAEGWDRRRASTIIHWVDGLWSIPAPANATAGTVYPLTTVVSRSTDAGGVEGWTVRYAIVGGAPAEFAPAGSQTAEASTDNDGRGTVQLRQVSGQFEPGTTQVRVDVVRPAMLGEPELVVESGITSVTWSAPALTIRAIGPRTAGVDESFNYRLEVTNPGDQTARDVVVRTKNLDEAIEYISATPKPTEYGRQFEWKLGDIAPGSQPRVIDVQLKSKKRGNVGMCFEVASDADRLRTEACAETEIAAPCLGLDIDGPTFARIGETVTFNLNVQNQCDEPLENIRLTVRHDQGLLNPGRSNPVSFDLDKLQFNETRTLPLTLTAQAPGTRCFDVEITAKNGHTSSARRCIEVGAQSSQQLQTQIGLEIGGGRPMNLGGETLVTARVTNRGNTPLDTPVLTNRFASSITAVNLTDGMKYDWLSDNELAVYLGQIQPGQTVDLSVAYQGLVVDSDAVSEFSVTTPQGANASEKISLRVEPAGTLNQPDQPDFSASGSASGTGPQGPIGIPSDPGPSTGDLSVVVRAVQRSIQVQNSAQSNASTPKAANVEFVVKNNSRSNLRDVDITINVPTGLQLTEFNYGTTNLDLVGKNSDDTQFYVRRVVELRAGEELKFIATVVGIVPGLSNFSVQAQSLDSAGAINGDSISVLQ